MRSYLLGLLSLVTFLHARAQDEFIERKTNEITDYSLKITKVTKDSLFYGTFGRSKKIALNQLYCYRYKHGRWIFPDSIMNLYALVAEGENARITNNRVTMRYKDPLFILEPYSIGKYYKRDDSITSFRINFFGDSLKPSTLYESRDVLFRLTNDSLETNFQLILHRIIPDTLIFRDYLDVKNYKPSYYVIPFNNVAALLFRSDNQIKIAKATSIAFGVLTLGTLNFGVSNAYGYILNKELRNKYNSRKEVNWVFEAYVPEERK